MGGVSVYMSQHRRDAKITELSTYFDDVIDWAGTTFTDNYKEQKGLDWGKLYRTFGRNPYDPGTIAAEVKKLYDDPYIKTKKGIFEYVLGGNEHPEILDVRVFDEATKRSHYATQTDNARQRAVSNCPLCAHGTNSNKTKIHSFAEMEADHVSAWSKGGADISGELRDAVQEPQPHQGQPLRSTPDRGDLTETKENIMDSKLTSAELFRWLADLIDEGIEPPDVSPYSVTWYTWSDNAREETRAIRAHLPYAIWEKVYTDDYFTLRTHFYGMRFDITTYRDRMCRQVVLGTELVQVPDPDHVVPMVTVEKEVVEWVCDE